MKENDVRISFLNQMPDSLAKGSLRDAWIAVPLKKTQLRLTTRGRLALFQQ